MAFDQKWLREQVRLFTRQRPAYVLYAQVLESLLRKACRQLGIEVTVGSRPKGIGSFTEKAVRKQAKYREPVHQITDLCGARVVTYTEADARLVHGYIRRNLHIDEANTVDAGKRLKTDQFGYKAMHFVVQMPWVEAMGMRAFDQLARRLTPALQNRLAEVLARPGGREADSVYAGVFRHAFRNRTPDLCAELLRLRSRTGPSRAARELAAEEMKLLEQVLGLDPAGGSRRRRQPAARIIGTIGNRKAEVQVCTALQHVWSFIGHDRLYKADFTPPPQIERQLHRVSALLEQADEEFGRGVQELDEYRLDYGAYLTPEQRRGEITKWQEAGRASKELSIALRIAGLAASLEDWKTVVKVLRPLRGGANAQVLTLLGRALSLSLKAGRAELKRATRLAPDSASAWCYLGDTYCEDSGCCAAHDRRSKQEKCADAVSCYGNAYSAEPDNPTALSRYVQCKLCAGASPRLLALLTPGLEAARNKARRRAEVGVHLPTALYDIGLFDLLLGRPYESLGAYAKAVFLSDSVLPIETALRSVDRLLRLKAGSDAPELMLHAGWVRRFLEMALVAKTYQLERLAAEELTGLNQQLAAAEHNVRIAQAELNRRKQKQVEKTLDAAKAQRKELRAKHGQAGKTLTRRQQASRQALALFRSRRRQTRPRAGGWKVTGPVTMVVGGCDAGTEQFMRAYRTLLVDAFDDCRGTVFSAGTTAGIGGLVGEVQQCYPELIAVGYLPQTLPGWADLDSRYRKLRRTPGTDDFSALEPLQNWTDIIHSGIRPQDVRVLGINGGRIAAFEYRMALAFDAWVAVLDESGREAAKLLPDENWGKAERLMVLPPEAYIVREYLRRPDPLPRLWQQLREPIGAEVHRDVVEEKLKNVKDPTMLDWHELPEAFRESSRQQVDHILTKLQHIGYGWLVVPRGQRLTVHRFDADTVEKLSELEHARFVIERFREGWKRGAKKDLVKKTNPTLVGWDELTDDVREYDRKTVRQIPYYLARYGIELIPPTITARPASRKGTKSK